MCASHIPHIIPSIDNTVFTIAFSSVCFTDGEPDCLLQVWLQAEQFPEQLPQLPLLWPFRISLMEIPVSKMTNETAMTFPSQDGI